ncbi:acyl-CoA carboxylase subunit epsilon [Actinophytocola sp.]|uniref:acyl-CoA carboxylase subunit epsilon n=1 Tax=Actinophytocola sp. TaxID=1872138 RepID=UPI003D6B9ABE
MSGGGSSGGGSGGGECQEGVLHGTERPEGVLPGRPVLRVVRGNPDDEELAALTAAVVALASAGAERAEPPPRSRWSDRGSLMRTPHRHGPGAWRASAF